LNGLKKTDQNKTNMGKAKKEHRKKVANRNKKIKDTEKRITKIWNEEIQKQIDMIRAEAEKEQMSADTENSDGLV